MEHRPFFTVYDSEQMVTSVVEIPIDPIEEVMNLEEVLDEKEKDEKLETFVAGLTETANLSLDFRKNVLRTLEEQDVEQSVKDIVHEVIEIAAGADS